MSSIAWSTATGPRITEGARMQMHGRYLHLLSPRTKDVSCTLGTRR